MAYSTYMNDEMIKKIWMSLDPTFMTESLKGVAGEMKDKFVKKAVSIIHQPAWEQARRFQDVHGSYIRRSAASHRIPCNLLAAIIFTEMTYNILPWQLDDVISMGDLPGTNSSSLGPPQVQTFHLGDWGYKGNKYELAWKLHSDIHFAIDMSARLLNELVVAYVKRRIEKRVKEEQLAVIRYFNGYYYTPHGWSNYKPDLKYRQIRIDSERLERDAWPTIAEWYNMGEGLTNSKYRAKFMDSLRALGFS